MTDKKIDWIDRGLEPKCSPNPAYPKGVDIIGHIIGQKNCKVDLPYPAKRCGIYLIECSTCGIVVACTTAGRPDDPRSITMQCRLQ